MDKKSAWRHTPPTAIWVAIALVVGTAVLCVLFAAVLWKKADQVESLEAQVAALQNERLSLESRLAVLQDAAKTTEQRLASLEANDPAQKLAALQQAVESVTDTQQVDELRASLNSVQAQLNGFQSSLDSLTSRLDSLYPSNLGALPAEARIQVVPHRQSHNLSCESSAASMAAQYHGVNLSEAEVLNALPRDDNPAFGFRGNVDGPTGGIQDYGVYAGPIQAVLDANGLAALPVSGGMDGIRAAIARGNPVIAWVTYQMRVSTPVSQMIAGKEVTLVPNEHVVVITGYDSAGFWANDPWTGLEEYYATADIVRAMGYFGNMALEVAGP
jgi:uncharacterized protein YvpB